MNNTQYINGLTGEKFVDKINPKINFCLNCEGQETINDDSGIIFVYPISLDKFDILRKSVKELLSNSSQKVFEVPQDSSYKEICSIKLKENEYLKMFHERCSNQLKKSKSCSKEYSFQLKGLKALSRNTQYILERFNIFVRESSILFKKFCSSKKKLNKNTEKIYTDLIIKDVSEIITKKKVKSLFDFVIFDTGDSNLDERRVLNKHYEKIEKYSLYGQSRIRGWETYLKCIEHRFEKLKENQIFSRFLSNSERKDEFLPFSENINKSLEKIKILVDNHSNQLEQLKMGEEDLTALNELNANNYLLKANEHDETIANDLYKCMDQKYKTDEKLYEFCGELLEARKNMTKLMENERKKFKNITDKVLEISLKRLIFAQNLPKVYEDSITELLRRKGFTDDLKKEILKINSKMYQKCEEENKRREKFWGEKEEFLGYKIPNDLIIGIYDYIKIPLVNINKVDPNLPDISSLYTEKEKIEEGFELIDDFEIPDKVPKNAEKKQISKELLGTVVERETLKQEKIYQREMNDLLVEFNESEAKDSKEKKEVSKKPKKVEIKISPEEVKIINLKKESEKMKKQIDRLKQVNDFIKKDKNQEIQKILNEKDEQIKLISSEKTRLLKESEDFKAKYEKKKKELEERILMTANSKEKEVDNLKKDIFTAWKQKDNAEKKIEIEKKKKVELEKENEKLKNNVKKVNLECQQKINNQKAVIVELKKKAKQLNDFVQPMLLENDKQKEVVKKLQYDVAEKEKKLKKHQININKIVSKFETVREEKLRLEAKKKELANVIGKQVKLIDDQQKEKVRLQNMMKNMSKQQKYEKYGKEKIILLEMGFNEELIMSCLEKFKGDVDKCVNEITSLSTKEKIKGDKRKIVVLNFKLYDRVLCKKIKKPNGNGHIWELMNVDPQKPSYLGPHMDTALAGNNTCLGSIFQINKVDVSSGDRNPLKLSYNHWIVLISAERKY